MCLSVSRSSLGCLQLVSLVGVSSWCLGGVSVCLGCLSVVGCLQLVSLVGVSSWCLGGVSVCLGRLSVVSWLSPVGVSSWRL